MKTSRVELEYRDLLQLQEKYPFWATYFDSSPGIIRVLAPCKFTDSGMDGRSRQLEAFYFEIHYPRRHRRSPQIFFPSDTFIPEPLRRLCSKRRVVTPPYLKSFFKSDPYKVRLKLKGGQQTVDAAGLVETVFRELQAKPVNGEEKPPKPRKRSFKIKSIEGTVELLKADRPLGLPLSDSSPKNRYNLFIEQQALDKIHHHIGWNQTTRENVVEQGGIYVGVPCRSHDGDFGVVKDVIPATNTKGTSTYIEFGHEIWATFLKDFDTQKALGTYQANWVILGWYHTHPNSLPVFMSATDMTTQQKLFHRDWNSALVLNPHKKLIAGFQGERADPCNVYSI